MRTRICIRLISLIFMALVCFPGEGKRKEEQKFDIYLLIGQSNMAGRGVMAEGDMKPIEGVWLLNAAGEPEPAANPLNRHSTVRKDMSMQKIGPGYSFSKKIASDTGRPVLLVVNALGGSSMEAWQKDAPPVTDRYSIAYGERKLFDEAVSRALQAAEYGEIKAILWHQGESNVNRLDTYLSGLGKIVSDMRTALGIPELPFIAGELGVWEGQHRKDHMKFNEVLRRISDEIPYSSYVTSEDCTPLDDKVHFDRESQLLMGERYAEKVLETVYRR